MVYQYTSTFEDYKAAQALARIRNRRLAASYYFWFWVLPLLGVFGLITLIIGNTILHLWFVDRFGTGLAGFSAGALYLGIYRPFWLRRCYKKCKNGSGENDVIEFELGDDALISRIPGRSEGKFFPTSIVAYAENEQIALIYVRKKAFLFIPKRAMTEVDWVQVRDWISSKTGVRTSC